MGFIEGKFEVLYDNSNNYWNTLIKNNEKWDVYYLFEYVNSMARCQDGKPILFHYSTNYCSIVCVDILLDIANYISDMEVLQKNKYYDMETPYGYGGPILSGEIEPLAIKNFYLELSEYCKKNNIITQFYRFHPILCNIRDLKGQIEYRRIKQTVYMDLSSEERIVQNMDSSRRRQIHKGEENGIYIIHDEGKNLDEFYNIYFETMKFKQADDFYFFDREYFEYLGEVLSDNIEYFYAMYKGECIASIMILYNKEYMHYHLGGTYTKYRDLAPTNLLFYYAALWGNRKGIKLFHLGGGLYDNDSLFRFKKQFNRKGIVDFYIGRNIFDKDKYEHLLSVRSQMDDEFDVNNSRMIQYRL